MQAWFADLLLRLTSFQVAPESSAHHSTRAANLHSRCPIWVSLKRNRAARQLSWRRNSSVFMSWYSSSPSSDQANRRAARRLYKANQLHASSTQLKHSQLMRYMRVPD